MGPLDVFLGWQALILAALVYMATAALKTLLDLTYGSRAVKRGNKATWHAKHVVGRALRRGNRWLTRMALPAAPPAIGALMAVLIPLRPVSLDAYVTATCLEPWAARLLYAAWGAACGQFADYLYTKLKALLGDRGAR